MRKNDITRNISLAINVIAIIVIAALICLNQATENKLKAATADSTPVEIEVSNSGALITFANGEGYYFDGKYIDNETVKSHENCISEEDVVYMSKDKYDYYELEIGDVNAAKYDRMAKRINYTKADMERDVEKYKEEERN